LLDAERERRDLASASMTLLIAMTKRLRAPDGGGGLATGSPTRQPCARRNARSPDGHRWPLDLAWADPAAATWTLGWSGVLAKVPRCSRRATRVAALVEEAQGQSRAERGGRIVARRLGAVAGQPISSIRCAWRPASRRSSTSSRGTQGQTPQRIGAPRGPRQPVIDFDVVDGWLAVLYLPARSGSGPATAEKGGREVYGGDRGEGSGIRWSPRGGVLGWLDGGGFQNMAIDSADSDPLRK
jgi:hypothetical protein